MVMKPSVPFLVLFSSVVIFASPSFAQDIRSLSMGGASVTSGTGVGGFVSNPALLLDAQRQQQAYHFRFGGQIEVRDNVDAQQLFEDNEDLLDDINAEIDTLSAQTLSCIPPVDENSVCLTGTQTLGTQAGDALTIFNQINGEPVDGQGRGDLGFAITHTALPFSINLGTRATASGLANISQADLDYAQNLNSVLSDNELTLGEINDTAPIEIAVSGQNISVDLPDDVLTSTARTSVLLRTQLAIGLAKSFDIGGRSLDVGVTPKFSSLRASSVVTTITELDDPDFKLQDQLETAEVTDSSLTVDVGVSLGLSQIAKRGRSKAKNSTIQVGAVIRNLAAESIKTNDGFEFETTPQLITSGLYSTGRFSFTGDLALNEAKQDNFTTQRLNLGAEASIGFFDLRGGIQHDIAVNENPTDLTIGFGLGFLDLAVVLDGSDVKGGGLQIAFSL